MSKTIKIPVQVEGFGWVITNGSNSFDANSYDRAYISNTSDYGGNRFRTEVSVKYDINDYLPSGKTASKLTFYLYANKDYPEKVKYFNKPITRGWNTIEIINPYPSYWISIYQETKLDYTNPNYMYFHTENGTNPAYGILEYIDTPPIANNLFPNVNNVDARREIEVSWNYSSIDDPKQKGSIIEWKERGQTQWSSAEVPGDINKHKFKANQFSKNSFVEYRIKVQDSRGIWSDYSEGLFYTDVVKQKPPINLIPSSGYLDGNEGIVFEWDFQGGADYDIQGKYEIHTSTNSINWTSIAIESKESKHIFEPGTFNSGTNYWKVKTYNEFGDESPFSEIERFNVIAKPPIPKITSLIASAKPLITWESVEQQSYTIKIKDNISNIVYEKVSTSRLKEHKVSSFLKDGEYKLELYITNSFGLDSDVTFNEFTVKTEEITQPNIEVFTSTFCNIIKTGILNNKLVVYRDEKAIGLIKDKLFKDYTFNSNEKHTYFIRAIDESENFSDSRKLLVRNKLNSNTLALASDPSDFIKLSYGLNRNPDKNLSYSIEANIKHFDGREYPVVEHSEFSNHNRNLKFIIRDKRILDKLIELINKRETFIYRDTDGENIYGSILDINSNVDIFGYNINFNISRVDYKGDVYD